MTLRVITTSTPVGDFHVITEPVSDQSSQEIVVASGFGPLPDLLARLPETLRFAALQEQLSAHPYQTLVQAYFQGDTQALEQIPTRQEGTEFYERVWKAMSAIPYGQTVSYKDLAQTVGNPHAVRAVGTTCRRNRLVLLVPCHRVVRTDGSRGGYLYGDKIKRYLLELEKGNG
jgi:methylated-DNA-[protein]-cysteine S-methyltransferase